MGRSGVSRRLGVRFCRPGFHFVDRDSDRVRKGVSRGGTRRGGASGQTTTTASSSSKSATTRPSARPGPSRPSGPATASPSSSPSSTAAPSTSTRSARGSPAPSQSTILITCSKRGLLCPLGVHCNDLCIASHNWQSSLRGGEKIDNKLEFLHSDANL